MLNSTLQERRKFARLVNMLELFRYILPLSIRAFNMFIRAVRKFAKAQSNFRTHLFCFIPFISQSTQDFTSIFLQTTKLAFCKIRETREKKKRSYINEQVSHWSHFYYTAQNNKGTYHFLTILWSLYSSIYLEISRKCLQQESTGRHQQKVPMKAVIMDLHMLDM